MGWPRVGSDCLIPQIQIGFGLDDVSLKPDAAILDVVKSLLCLLFNCLPFSTILQYIKHLVYNIAKQGWNVVVSNHRGLGGVSITVGFIVLMSLHVYRLISSVIFVQSDRFYNAGWTEDIRKVINHLHLEYPKAPLFAIGTSIGANMLVKYLGEEGDGTPVAGAASICSPWDLVVGIITNMQVNN
ncbi:hypothetical protein Taro_020537 [Colocasia esculenta]|uniref:Serine aminopeptidase S33 domain-containing protein n=1 Tax=Colocasia esculenta TaxID=4460 RepID=A0A843UNX2_COLES|nr:hypothetical protein [Colocasia esculenta]